jgi:uncharacterized membrane protein
VRGDPVTPRVWQRRLLGLAGALVIGVLGLSAISATSATYAHHKTIFWLWGLAIVSVIVLITALYDRYADRHSQSDD